MNDSAFVARASDLCPDGAIIGGKRARTHEVKVTGGAGSPLPSPPTLSMSFKDKVSADFGMAEDNMVIGDDDYVIQYGEVPSIQLSDKIKDYLYRPWKSAIIIKLMDMEYVLTGGPWQIIGQYVTTQRWKPRFDVLEKIRNLIGHTVKVDSHTMSQARGKFARICVELDISKPLTPFIVVEGRTYGVVYEGIQVICFECGYYGHGRDNCPLNEKVKAQASEATEPESMIDVNSPNNKAVDIENLVGTRTEQVVGVAVSAGSKTTEESPNLHGQWMLLKRKKTKKTSPLEVGKDHAEEKKYMAAGSRFSVLEIDPITNQNSPIGVKRATHSLAPKKIFGRGKPSVAGKSTHVKTKSVTSKMTDVGTTLVPEHHGSSSMTLDNKTTPLNCVGDVGLQVQGSDFQDDVQGIFSFNVGVPLASPAVLDAVTLPPDHDPADIDSMDVIIDGSASDVQTSISAEHSQAWEALARSDLDLPDANDVPPATQRDKTNCGSKALNVATNLGFSHYHIVDATGFSGGIWLLWNGSSVSLQVIAHASQSIAALVHVRNKCWLLTVVYANPNPRIRESLWTYFDGLARASNLPWLVMGDFNDISCASEKCDGNFDSRGSAFVDWISRNQLIDLGFSGSKFTWCNKKNAEGIIWKRIDRGLSNIAWRLMFPEALSLSFAQN
ncbi:hypothetical protein OIU85_014250 [Salix viminalis]|uniref:CCHC-type domain-containing protein n=1 Tax=Salix viminalis TaxID=40686 RepID=A0A9Q0SAN1_SALVM|nr:hypothetical protein OIU85_014250 [Salix viminalis]